MLDIVYNIRQTNGEDPKTTKRKRNKMKNTLPNGTTSLVSKWNKGDYYTIEANNGETIIAGSGKTGLKRAVEHAAKNPEAYSHIRWESDASYIIYNLDGTRTDDPVISY